LTKIRSPHISELITYYLRSRSLRSKALRHAGHTAAD